MFAGRCARTESEVNPWDSEDDVDDEDATEDIEVDEDRDDDEDEEGGADAEELDNDVDDELEALARSMVGQCTVSADGDDGDEDGGSCG